MATLGLLAWLGLTLGLGSQLVYCVGPDGHSGIELAHATAPCDPIGSAADGHATASHTSGGVSLASEACTDIPLLGQLSSKYEKPGNASLVSHALLAIVAPATAGRQPARALCLLAGHCSQRAAFIRSTVLRV
ncbi:MAG: hypothetical protein H8E45_05420 [Proteobacteria bacterium]|nr:hypothetical protein [Pseudomonadota bacterium]